MDPTNGFTAISAAALKHLPLDKIDNRFFFEQDMLFRLNTIRAVVTDYPMKAEYDQENSNLKIPRKRLFTFPLKYINRLLKEDILLLFSSVISMSVHSNWPWPFFSWDSGSSSVPSNGHTVLSRRSACHRRNRNSCRITCDFSDLQSFLSFLHFDLTNIPQKPISGLED
ncbi:MAG: hypothetical protein MZV64_24425 [Ignavibacteriales bacterium]|nr:hypothetical protein [Ignavibacteriales bacterium]